MKKRLIVIIGSLNVGGAERHVVSILPKLAASGWSIQVITLTTKGVLAPLLEKGGIPVTALLTPWHTKFFEKFPERISQILRISTYIVKLALILRREKKSLLHFFLPESYVVGMLAAKLVRFSGHTIMSRRSLNNYQRRRKGIGWFEEKLHAKTSAILCNSLAVIANLKTEKGVPGDRIHLIYNGIDTTPFLSFHPRLEVRKKLGITQDAFVMIKVANLIPYKGHADLLQALASIKQSLPQVWHLICVGQDNGIGSQLKQLAARLGLSKHILWLGSRSDIPAVLCSADLGILCSHEEGFSNAILEGMAAGLPMVVTDVGGNKEAVVHTETGYVVPAKDSVALAQAILQLTSDPNKVLQFGRAARERVNQCFSLDACVQAYIKLYETLMMPNCTTHSVG